MSKDMNEKFIRAFLSARAGGVPVEEFAEHILRNYSFKERTAFGVSPIEQAYGVIMKNLRAYEERQIRKDKADNGLNLIGGIVPMSKNTKVKSCGIKQTLTEKLREIQENGRKEYEQALFDFCPSDGFHNLADYISAQVESCNFCAFCGDKSCNSPYPEFHVDYLNIDPCFEGVLRYFVGEADKTKEESGLTPEETDGLLDMMERAQEREKRYAGIISVLSGIIIGTNEGTYKIPSDILELIRDLYSSTNDLLERLREFDENDGETD